MDVSDELASDLFINAFRRFIEIRGDVCILHTDQGTNLVDGCNELLNAPKNRASSDVSSTLAKLILQLCVQYTNCKSREWCVGMPILHY